MSVKSQLSRQDHTGRSPHKPRLIIIPDRTVKQTFAVAPIINSPPKVHLPNKLAHSNAQTKLNTPKHRAIKSSSLHTVPQATQAKRSRVNGRQQDKTMSTAGDMERLLKRHNGLSRQLARTAGRAQVLTNALRVEEQKVRWHRKFIFGLING